MLFVMLTALQGFMVFVNIKIDKIIYKKIDF